MTLDGPESRLRNQGEEPQQKTANRLKSRTAEYPPLLPVTAMGPARR
jgi:hypothetical protein